MLRLPALLLIAAGALLLGEQCYLSAKAALADVLIDRALGAHLADGGDHAPWPWADFHPIARLEVPRLGIDRQVVSGASGSSMAFGIGHLDGTAPPGAPGHCVLVGHRDSWCRFLRRLEIGDLVRLTSVSRVSGYEVLAAEVVDERDPAVLDPSRAGLTLVTCYPFDGLGGSPWRYVVHCRPLDGS